jgi:hypothetical protein
MPTPRTSRNTSSAIRNGVRVKTNLLGRHRTRRGRGQVGGALPTSYMRRFPLLAAAPFGGAPDTSQVQPTPSLTESSRGCHLLSRAGAATSRAQPRLSLPESSRDCHFPSPAEAVTSRAQLRLSLREPSRGCRTENARW